MQKLVGLCVNSKLITSRGAIRTRTFHTTQSTRCVNQYLHVLPEHRKGHKLLLTRSPTSGSCLRQQREVLTSFTRDCPVLPGNALLRKLCGLSTLTSGLLPATTAKRVVALTYIDAAEGAVVIQHWLIQLQSVRLVIPGFQQLVSRARPESEKLPQSYALRRHHKPEDTRADEPLSLPTHCSRFRFRRLVPWCVRTRSARSDARAPLMKVRPVGKTGAEFRGNCSHKTTREGG